MNRLGRLLRYDFTPNGTAPSGGVGATPAPNRTPLDLTVTGASDFPAVRGQGLNVRGWEPVGNGTASYFDGAVPTSILTEAAPYTIELDITFAEPLANNASEFVTEVLARRPGQWEIGYNPNAGGPGNVVYFITFTTGGAGFIASDSGQIPTGRNRLHLVFRNTPTVKECFLNGRLVSTGTNSTEVDNPPTGNITIPTANNFSNPNVQYNHFRLYEGFLSGSEVRDLYANRNAPYVDFSDINFEAPLLVGRAAAGSTIALSGTVAESSTLTADISTTQAFAGTAAEVSTQTADIALSGTFTGTGAESTAHTADIARGPVFAGTAAESTTQTADVAVAVSFAATAAEASTHTADIAAATSFAATAAESSATTAIYERAFSTAYVADIASQTTGQDYLGVSYIQGIVGDSGAPLTPNVQVGTNRELSFGGGAATSALLPDAGIERIDVPAANRLRTLTGDGSILTHNYADGTLAFTDFEQGGTRYTTSLADWTAYDTANGSGVNQVARFLSIVMLTQYLEDASGTAASVIVSNNETLRTDRTTDLTALTSQSELVATWHPIPSFSDDNSGAAQTLDWALAIEDWVDITTGVFSWTPNYVWRIGSDLVHLTPNDQLYFAELLGVREYQLRHLGHEMRGMRMLSARASGNDIIIRVHVPALAHGTAVGAPATIDTSGLVDTTGVTNAGFRYVANGGPARTITNVVVGSQISGTNQVEVTVTLDAAAPTSTPVAKVDGQVPAAAGAFIGYADFGSNPTTGATSRGLVRDSETIRNAFSPTLSALTFGGQSPATYNWMNPGQVQITTGTVAFSGTGAEASAQTSDLAATRAFSGTVVESTVASTDLAQTRVFTAVAAETSTYTADAARTATLTSAAATESSALVADLARSVVLSAAFGESSSQTSQLGRTVQGSATVAEDSVLSADLATTALLAALAAETSALTADIDLQVFGVVALSGAGVETSTATIDLARGLPFAAAVAEASALTIDTARALSFGVSAGEASALSVLLGLSGVLSGLAVEASQLDAAPNRQFSLASTAAEAAVLSADLVQAGVSQGGGLRVRVGAGSQRGVTQGLVVRVGSYTPDDN